VAVGTPAGELVTDPLVGAMVPTWSIPPEDAGGGPPGPALPAAPVDPAVERALSRLRTTPTDDREARPGAAALVAARYALDQVGDPYVWGATGPGTYDCSGLTWRSYFAARIPLPRVSRDQHASGGEPVEVDDLLPGDLVFFATAAWDPGVVHHVGMYVGGGLMVDAPRPGLTVRVEPVWAQGYVGAVRPVPARDPLRPPDRRPRPTPTGRPTSGPGARPTTHPTTAAPTIPPTAPPTTATTSAPPTPTVAPTPTPTPTVVTPTPTPTAKSTPIATPTALPLAPVELVAASLVRLVRAE
jgi:peptidoglycan DL-endopeptidase CwlO